MICAGCRGAAESDGVSWPEPPAVDQAQYRKGHDAWLERHHQALFEAYPLDPRWRMAARFDAFDQPKSVRVPDVRGGEMEFIAVGQLVFRIDGQEMRLTAFGEPDSDEFFVMFKDPTNQTSTFRGYRILSPKLVKGSEWTAIDFNFASNPPCAYSRYTVCPLPPRREQAAGGC